ncbi:MULTISPECIES: SMI1/KNR4 family protein [unclassified Streptomyces]|uniref:SMI1/KNR4 family protein n=1 Tax=unclassified Streptomyces TaxID=2593676 RepID=UPI0036E641A6
MDIDNWTFFLERWSRQWFATLDLLDPEDAEEQTDDEAVVAGSLGLPPAGEEQIAALEQRLGLALPPSYRSFLHVSNGWRHASSSVYLMGIAERVEMHGDPGGMRRLYEGNLDETSGRAERLRAGMWARSLQLSHDSDMTDVLLDPGDVGEDGEWAVYVYRGWSGEFPERYPSFAAYMRSMYRDFHAWHGDNPDFVTEVTRELDAAVERARSACLAGGDIEEQLAVLDEADGFGRERARRLRDQIHAMFRPGGHVAAVTDMADPLYVREILPLKAMVHRRTREDDDWFLRPHGAEGRAEAEAALREADERSFRYEPPGLFGRAVAEARELARWGDTEGAWRVLAAAVPDWEPYGTEHVAPLGLLADPFLGPVVTPERGRQILNTARAGHGSTPGSTGATTASGSTGAAAAPGSTGAAAAQASTDAASAVEVTAATAPDGLGWLAEPDSGACPDGFRFVLVHGTAPQELAQRLGEGPLLAPCSEGDLRWWGRRDGPVGDGPHARIGSCGGGWSFAFETGPEPFREDRLTGLDAQASLGTRAISVWCRWRAAPAEPGPGAPAPTLRFSYAEDGQEVYGYTHHGEARATRGTLPEPLDTLSSGRPALDAIADAYGVSLPRFALRSGRLHAVAARSWTGARHGVREAAESQSTIRAVAVLRTRTDR